MHILKWMWHILYTVRIKWNEKLVAVNMFLDEQSAKIELRAYIDYKKRG